MIYTEKHFFEALTSLLDELSGCWAVDCIWKQGETMRVVVALPLCHRLHLSPLCQAVKAFCGDGENSRCRRNDEWEIVNRAAKDKRHFLHRCHAGAWELVLPRFAGDRYVGTLLVGPFRKHGETAEYAECRAAYESLIELDDARVASMAALAHRVLTPVLERMCGELGQAGDPRIAEAMLWLRRNFRQKIEIPDLCRKVALSESHFQHLFRRAAGVSCGAYLTDLRLEEARRLLTGTRLPIAEIAQVCCLIDQSRMTLLFRRRYGITPAKFRNQEHAD